MLKVVIEDARVISCSKTTLTAQAGERVKEEVIIAVNTPRSVELYQVEVWDDNIDKMNLQPNEVVTLDVALICKQNKKDGRWYNTLQAYRAERGTATQAAAQVQTDEVF